MPTSPYGLSKLAQELVGGGNRGRAVRAHRATVQSFRTAPESVVRRIGIRANDRADRSRRDAPGNPGRQSRTAARSDRCARYGSRLSADSRARHAGTSLQRLLGTVDQGRAPARHDAAPRSRVRFAWWSIPRATGPTTRRSSRAIPRGSAKSSAGRRQIPVEQTIDDLLAFWRERSRCGMMRSASHGARRHRSSPSAWPSSSPGRRPFTWARRSSAITIRISASGGSAWIAHALVTSPLHLFDANIFYPAKDTLAYSDATLLEGLLAAPFLWMHVSPVLVYNVLLPGRVCRIRHRDVRAGPPPDRRHRSGARRGRRLHAGAVPHRAHDASRAAVGDVRAADVLGAASRHRRSLVAIRHPRRTVFLAADPVVRVLRRLSGHPARRVRAASSPALRAPRGRCPARSRRRRRGRGRSLAAVLVAVRDGLARGRRPRSR